VEKGHLDNKNISPDFPFKSNFIEIHDSKIHYIDEGTGDPILFLHGNPTSSYLWRNIIPYVIPHGRCIAPDLIGMGKSDKPDIDYRFVDHAKYIEGFIREMKLENITLVIHDWGSGLGFNYALKNEENIKGLAFMEAILKTASWADFPKDFRIGFKMFRTPVIGWEEERNRYREPFRRLKDRKPLWRWPNEIPIDGQPKDVFEIVQNYSQKLQESELPKLLFYAEPGGILPKEMVDWCKQHLKNLQTVHIGQGIHYLQEDNPHVIGSELAMWYKNL
jgi:haloalkane dehalogenase